LKILYVLNRKPNIAGIQVTTRNRVKALRERQIDAEVMFFEHGNAEYLFDDIPHFFINNSQQFQNHLLSKEYDFISYIYSPQYLDSIPENYKSKILFEIRGWSSSVTKALTQINKSNRFNAIICIAEYIKPLVEKRLKKNIPVFVDGNLVPFNFKPLAPRKRNWKEFLKRKRNHKIIGFVGSLNAAKNWEEWIKIGKGVSENEQIELWIICRTLESAQEKQLKELSERLGLTGRIKILPSVPNSEMPNIYSIIAKSGGCILSTSPREGLGNHILEPMACGCPVVSSNRPGKNEMIIHKYNGLLYELGDIDGAIRQIKELFNNEYLRMEIINKAILTIEQKYRAQNYVDRYLQILSQI